jgi:hypothetical protein
VGPKALAEGHKSLTKKNDMRDISQKMFNATFEEKQMLCSEYAVKSQLATIDQLNKLTSYDLMAAGFIDKEEKIIKNLVSSKEKLDRVHPGRLVEILKESGAVTKIETNANKFINTEKLDVSKKTNKDHAKPLSDKIYSILKESTSKEDFQKKSFEATDKYLDSYEVNKETKDAVKTKITSKELPELYDQFKQKPKGIKAKIKNTCKKALEFCKIIKVDRNIKQNIEQIISSPKTEEPVKKVASSEQKVESLKQSTDVEKVPGTDLKKLPNKKDQQLMEGQDAPTPKKNVFAKAFDKFKTTVKERFNEIKPKVTEGNQKIKEAPSDIQEKMTDVKAKVPSFKSLAEINQQQPIAPNLSRIIPQKQETQPEAPPIPPRKQETTPEVPPLPPRKQETTPEVPPLPPRKQETTPEVPPLPPRKQETTPEVPPLPPRKQETTPEVPPLPPRKQETTPEVPPLPPRKQETKPEIPPIPPPKPSIDKMREALSSRSSSNTMTSKPPPLPQRPNKGGGMSMG